jgi:hypothetical protein
MACLRVSQWEWPLPNTTTAMPAASSRPCQPMPGLLALEARHQVGDGDVEEAGGGDGDDVTGTQSWARSSA